VRTAGADAYLVDDPALAEAFAARLASLKVAYERADVDKTAIFHHFSRPVALEEVEGFDQGAHAQPPRPSEETTSEQ
jgi:hypothetical protein